MGEPAADLETGPLNGAISKILIVDDSRLQRRILSGILKRWGFDVLEAESGEQALQICAQSRPDLIFSDWVMPRMNGLEFCRNFRDLPGDDYSYFILLTSKSEKDEVAQGLHAGADDFLTKPVNSDELRARIAAGGRILAMQKELSSKNKVISDTLGRLQELYDGIDRDLQQARTIQESLVPELSREISGSDFSLLLKPCGHIGGDLVGMFSPGPGRAGFYSIDVSGHGITSAMMTARLGGYLSSSHFDNNIAVEKRFGRFYALREPSAVARLLNERLMADSGVEEYFTMAYGTVDLRNGLTRIVQAGHPHPLLLRSTGEMEFIGKGGAPIGLLPDMNYDQLELYLEPGDRILLYSDGFTECRLKSGEMLEDQGLLELIQQQDNGARGEEFLSDLYWRLTELAGEEAGFDDDVSATLFEFKRYDDS